MNFDERLLQCDKDITALRAEKEKILKEKEQERKFYIGEKFTYGASVYMLIKDHDKDVARLLSIDSNKRSEIGSVYKNSKTVVVYNGIYPEVLFTKQLPTEYPSDFGLESRYGI